MGKTLDLRLYGVYFDLIKAGKKKREYRDLNDYYVKRLMGGVENLEGEKLEEFIANIKNPSEREQAMKKQGAYYRVGNKPNAYTQVRFRRGANAVFLTTKIDDMFVDAGKFVIVLGDTIKEQNEKK